MLRIFGFFFAINFPFNRLGAGGLGVSDLFLRPALKTRPLRPTRPNGAVSMTYSGRVSGAGGLAGLAGYFRQVAQHQSSAPSHSWLPCLRSNIPRNSRSGGNSRPRRLPDFHALHSQSFLSVFAMTIDDSCFRSET